MTIPVKFDIYYSYSMGRPEHRMGSVELPKWNAAEALKQLKWRNPSAEKIVILSHG